MCSIKTCLLCLTNNCDLWPMNVSEVLVSVAAKRNMIFLDATPCIIQLDPYLTGKRMTTMM